MSFLNKNFVCDYNEIEERKNPNYFVDIVKNI